METKKPKATNLLDLMTPEERARIEARQAIREAEQAKKITQEALGLSELGVYYGWGAVQAVIDDTITLEQANMFVEGARKIHSGHVFDYALATLAGNSTKKGVFESVMKRYIDDMKAVN